MNAQTRKHKNHYIDREFTALLSLLKRHRTQPKKRLGQTFLFKQSIAEEIARLADIKSYDTVVEIGAGLGALTIPLAERAANVIGLEYDIALVSILQKIIRHKNVEIIRADALNFDYREIFTKYKTKLKIIGNLPYYMTSPLIFKLLKLKSIIEVILIMIQKEVADRVVAQPGTKNYGTISIFSQLYCDVSKHLTVSKDCFYPCPKVDSEVVTFTIRESPVVELKDEQFFEKLVRTSFSQRRKTLLNSLKGAHYFNRGKQKIVQALEQSGIDYRRRPETLTISEFNTLCQQIISD
jgi:16S rRNA (adenine1518-N6/adenine1519-N6)-dimethyltransferase